MNKLTVRELGVKFKETRNEKYFNQLFYKVKPSLISYINNIIHDSDDSEDIYSYTMTTVYNKIDQFNPKWNISTWIYKIALNASRVYLRYQKRENITSFTAVEFNSRSIDKIDFSVAGNVENSYFEDEAAKEEKAMFAAQYDKVMSVINDCGELYQEILIDRFVHDLKYDEIAEKRNLPIHTVRNRIRRGKLRVLEVFEKEQKIK